MLNERQGRGSAAEGGFFMPRKYWLILFIAAAVLLFAGNGSLLVTDSVESNYALTAKEMVLSGDWLSPQIYGHYWYDKPIFFYWLTALAYKMFGFTEFASRFFPALFGLGGLALVAWGGSKLENERSGFCSALVLLSSVEFFLISKSVITDAVLFFFFSATLLFFYLGYRDGKASYWYIMYGAAGLAVLTKGPIGVLLPGLIITLFLLWQRDWRVLKRMRLASGTLLCLAVAVPWYAEMYSLHGSDFINTFFGTHNFLRATVSEHPRDDVFYYYTLVNLLALFPWSGLVPWAAYKWQKAGRPKLTEQQRFLLLWALVVFVFFQCMATKYITYTYPLLFPASLLLGSLLAKQADCVNGGYMLFVGGGLGVLLVAAWWAESSRLVAAELLFLLPLALIIGVLLDYIIRLCSGKRAYSIAAMSVVFYIALVFSIAVPFSEQRSAKDLGEMLTAQNAQEVGLYGKYPTSAVFYSSSKIVKLLHEQEVAGYVPKDMSWTSKNVMPYATLEHNPYRMVVVTPSSYNSFVNKQYEQWQVVDADSSWIMLRLKKS